MYILGINAYHGDAAAAIIHDGELVAAVEEERFNRIKHGKRPLPFTAWELPFAAIDYCLGAAGIGLADVQHVAYSFDPEQFPARPRGEKLCLPVEPSRHADETAPAGWARDSAGRSSSYVRLSILTRR